jgi:hypothetical protein
VLGAGIDEGLQPGPHVLAGAGDGHPVNQRFEARAVALLAGSDEGGRPPPGLVAVVIDPDVDEAHPLESGEVSATIGGGLLDEPYRLGVADGRVQERHPPVAAHRRLAHRGRLAPRHDDRRPGLGGRPGRDAHGLERPELPVVVDLTAGPQRAHHVDGLVRPRSAVSDLSLAGAELHRVLAPHPHAERYPAPGQPVKLGGLLGYDHRVIQRREQHGGAHGCPLGQRGQGGQAGHRLGHVPAGSDVAGRPQRVDPQRLKRRHGRPGIRQGGAGEREAHPGPAVGDAHERPPFSSARSGL